MLGNFLIMAIIKVLGCPDAFKHVPFAQRKMSAEDLRWRQNLWVILCRLHEFRYWASPAVLARILRSEYGVLVREADIRSFFRRPNETILQRFGYKKVYDKVSYCKNRMWIRRLNEGKTMPFDPKKQSKLMQSGKVMSDSLWNASVLFGCEGNPNRFDKYFNRAYMGTRRAYVSSSRSKRFQQMRKAVTSGGNSDSSSSSESLSSAASDSDTESDELASASDSDSDASDAIDVEGVPVVLAADLVSPVRTTQPSAPDISRGSGSLKRRRNRGPIRSQGWLIQKTKSVLRKAFPGTSAFQTVARFIAAFPKRMAKEMAANRTATCTLFKHLLDLQVLEKAVENKSLTEEDVVAGMFRANLSVRAASRFIDALRVRSGIDAPKHNAVSAFLRDLQKSSTPVLALENQQYNTHWVSPKAQLVEMLQNPNVSKFYDWDLYDVEAWYRHKTVHARRESEKPLYSNLVALCDQKRREGKYSGGGVLLKSTTDGLNLKNAVSQHLEITLTQVMNSTKLRTNSSAPFVSVISAGRETDAMIKKTLPQYYEVLLKLLFEGVTFWVDGKECWLPVWVQFASDLKFWWAVDGIQTKAQKKAYSPCSDVVHPRSMLRGFLLECRCLDNLHASFPIVNLSFLPFQQYMFELTEMFGGAAEGFKRGMDVLNLFGFKREQLAIQYKICALNDIRKEHAVGLLDTLNVDAGILAKVNDTMAKYKFSETQNSTAAIADWMKASGKTSKLVAQHLPAMMDIMADMYVPDADDPVSAQAEQALRKRDTLRKQIEDAEAILDECGVIAVESDNGV